MSLIEIRWHGRGGQGVKTAAIMVAQVALEKGKFIQGFPEYGPERSGAPVTGYTRISDEPIEVHSSIQNPDIVIVLDSTLIESSHIADGIKDNSTILVNTPLAPEQISKRIDTGNKKIKIYSVDANEIAIKYIGRPIPNIPLIGAFARITNFADMDHIKKSIQKKFQSKYSEKVVSGNLKALEVAYNEVRGG